MIAAQAHCLGHGFALAERERAVVSLFVLCWTMLMASEFVFSRQSSAPLFSTSFTSNGSVFDSIFAFASFLDVFYLWVCQSVRGPLSKCRPNDGKRKWKLRKPSSQKPPEITSFSWTRSKVRFSTRFDSFCVFSPLQLCVFLPNIDNFAFLHWLSVVCFALRPS